MRCRVMAQIEVETLTDDCWETCEDFCIDSTLFIGDGNIYHRIHKCENVGKCRRIEEVIKQELKGGSSE